MSTDVAAFVNWRLRVGPGSSRGRSLISSRTSSANRRALLQSFALFRHGRASPCTIPARTSTSIKHLPNYPITKFSASADSAFVLQFKYVRRMKIECRSRAFIRASELRMAAVADGDFLQPSVNHEIDERRDGEDAVRDEVDLVIYGRL